MGSSQGSEQLRETTLRELSLPGSPAIGDASFGTDVSPYSPPRSSPPDSSSPHLDAATDLSTAAPRAAILCCDVLTDPSSSAADAAGHRSGRGAGGRRQQRWQQQRARRSFRACAVSGAADGTVNVWDLMLHNALSSNDSAIPMPQLSHSFKANGGSGAGVSCV